MLLWLIDAGALVPECTKSMAWKLSPTALKNLGEEKWAVHSWVLLLGSGDVGVV